MKKGRRIFALLLFLKTFSWETDLLVTLGDFMAKKKKKKKKNRKIGKGNLYLTESRFSRNEMWCAVVNHDHVRYICAKGFLDSNFN